jgi:2-aminoadipate transaminase
MNGEIVYRFSENSKNMRRSPVRSLLSRADASKLISFAGGYPNRQTFPVKEISEIMMEVMSEEPFSALQYGATEGNSELRNLIAASYNKKGLDITKENVLITTASQQALDLCSKIFLDPGDTVLCEVPSYLGALQAFWSCSAVPVGIKEGERLQAVVEKLIDQRRTPKFIYTIPDFQNPSGVTLTLKQRQELVEVAKKYNLIIVEDSPYRELRYEGEDIPLICSLDKERALLLGTFSKTFAPGFRLGWIIAPVEIIDRLSVAKQSADLCTSVFDQAVAVRYLKKGLYEVNCAKSVNYYRERRDRMLYLLEKYMPDGITWNRPEGGLFIFMRLPEYCDSDNLFSICIDKNVAFVPGALFHCDGSGNNTLRLNFSYVDEDKMETGIKILSESINTMLGMCPRKRY